jgi:hypothetical protein
MTRVEGTRRGMYGLGESKTIMGEVYVFLGLRTLWALAYRA